MHESYLTGILLSAVLICIAAAVVCAGCIDSGTASPYTIVPVPDDMENALSELQDDLKKLDLFLTMDLYYLADEAGAAGGAAEISDLIADYYAAHSWLSRIVYYSNTSGTYLEYPIESGGQILRSM